MRKSLKDLANILSIFPLRQFYFILQTLDHLLQRSMPWLCTNIWRRLFRLWLMCRFRPLRTDWLNPKLQTWYVAHLRYLREVMGTLQHGAIRESFPYCSWPNVMNNGPINMEQIKIDFSIELTQINYSALRGFSGLWNDLILIALLVALFPTFIS